MKAAESAVRDSKILPEEYVKRRFAFTYFIHILYQNLK